jgi:hypothetical protein
MPKRLLTVLICVIILTLSSFAAARKPAKKAAASGPGPDKAYMQKLWDAWGTLDVSKAGEFYAQGPHTFFDVSPLKYNSWDEYATGLKKELADYKGGTFTVNDDPDLSRWRLLLGSRYGESRRDPEKRQARNGNVPLDRSLSEAGRQVAHRT